MWTTLDSWISVEQSISTRQQLSIDLLKQVGGWSSSESMSRWWWQMIGWREQRIPAFLKFPLGDTGGVNGKTKEPLSVVVPPSSRRQLIRPPPQPNPRNLFPFCRAFVGEAVECHLWHWKHSRAFHFHRPVNTTLHLARFSQIIDMWHSCQANC